MRELNSIWKWRSWLNSMEDPAREEILGHGTPNLDKILQMYQRPVVESPFDPRVIRANIERLETTPEIDTGHPYLDESIQTGLAFIDATFQGDRPKYGTDSYGQSAIDPFPPIIISTIDALTQWGINQRASQLFRYWLLNMVHPDGRLIYRAVCLSEYGQILHTAALLLERAGAAGWLDEGFVVLDRMAEYILRERRAVESSGKLIAGPADEDVYGQIGRYFHSNGWLAKGLERFADLCERYGATPTTKPITLRATAKVLRADTLAALQNTWSSDPDDWWLSPRLEPTEKPTSLTSTLFASYANYRYFPEIVSCDLLPDDLANRVVEMRLHKGGQFCGVTRIWDHLDDWPLADYLHGLWKLGRKDDFLICLYGHLAYSQAEETFTACEQVTFPQGRSVAPYCLPCQLTAARVARLLVT